MHIINAYAKPVRAILILFHGTLNITESIRENLAQHLLISLVNPNKNLSNYRAHGSFPTEVRHPLTLGDIADPKTKYCVFPTKTLHSILELKIFLTYNENKIKFICFITS